jgi:replicative DNA helicase
MGVFAMSQQPEALRLADELECPVGTQSTYSAIQQAAAELRRLYEENNRLNNLCYDYLGQLTAIRAAEQMRKQIEAIKKSEGKDEKA